MREWRGGVPIRLEVVAALAGSEAKGAEELAVQQAVFTSDILRLELFRHSLFRVCCQINVVHCV